MTTDESSSSRRLLREEDEEDASDQAFINSLSIHLGGSTPRRTQRTEAEIVSSYATVKKEDRAQMKVSEFSKLQLSAEEGEKTHFTLVEIDGVSNREQIKKLAMIHALLKVLKRSMQTFDMVDVFSTPKKMTDNAGVWLPEGNESVDLFEAPNDVDLATVLHACSFRAKFGQDFVIQNLNWSGKRILNSCDDNLKGKILEELSGYDLTAQAGPVYLKVLLDLILTASHQSLRGLVTQFQTLSPKDFPGENVMEYITHARGAYEMLRQHNALPFDALLIIVTALQDVSTEQFKTLIKTAHANYVLKHKPLLTVRTLFDTAQQEYNSLAASGQWERGNGGQSHDAVFVHQQNQDAASFHSGRGGRGRGGRGRSGGRGSRGGGRSARGHGRNFGYEKDRRPPAPGEPKERDSNGRPEKWCGTCGYWTWGADYAHNSDVCPYRQQHAANVSVTEASNSQSVQDTTASGSESGSNNNIADTDNSEGRGVRFAGVPALHFS